MARIAQRLYSDQNEDNEHHRKHDKEVVRYSSEQHQEKKDNQCNLYPRTYLFLRFLFHAMQIRSTEGTIGVLILYAAPAMNALHFVIPPFSIELCGGSIIVLRFGNELTINP